MTTNKPGRTAGAQSLFVYSAALHDYVVQQLRSNQESAELAQEVHQRLARIDPAELARQPAALVFSVASQLASEHKSGESSPVASARDVANPDPSDAELQQRVTAFMEKLTTAHRAILVLSKRDKFSIDGIAQQLNIPAPKVRRYLTEAGRQFTALLGKHCRREL